LIQDKLDEITPKPKCSDFSTLKAHWAAEQVKWAADAAIRRAIVEELVEMGQKRMVVKAETAIMPAPEADAKA